MKNTIYKSSIKAGARTYIFEVNEQSAGHLCLEIAEKRIKSKDVFEWQRITINSADIKEFRDELLSVIDLHLHNKL